MPEVIKRIWTIYDLTNELAQIYGARDRQRFGAWRARRSQDRGGVAVMGVYIRGALIAWSIWWLFYAIGSSRTEAEMPRLDVPAFNDRFSDWVAVEPPKAKMVET